MRHPCPFHGLDDSEELFGVPFRLFRVPDDLFDLPDHVFQVPYNLFEVPFHLWGGDLFHLRGVPFNQKGHIFIVRGETEDQIRITEHLFA